MKTLLRSATLAIVMICFGLHAIAQLPVKVPFTKEEWTKDYEPFRIAGNLYYVGTYDLGCYLITTPEGHILINTGLEESADMIRKHVEALGFKFSDIKILLTTHVHFDHVGAMATVKKMTGAKMMVNQYDAPVLADGGTSDYLMGGKNPTFAAVKADRLLHDHDTVALGGTKVIALQHPGHTKGSMSYLLDVHDEHKTYRVLIANMPTVIVEGKMSEVTAYPNIIKDYKYTFDAMKKVKFDLWVASHTSQFDLDKKHKPGDKYRPEAFADRKGYDTHLEELRKGYLKKLKEK
jgi:metallo-beta-lactamase class B